MRVLPPSLDLSLDGFASHDIFGRSRLADGLANLLNVSEDPLVLAIDGQWGAGKTTFLRMWSDKLRNDGFPVIHFDAFEHDYVADPFLVLAAEVIALAESLAPKEKRMRKELLDKSKAAGKVILRHSGSAAIKVLTLGALDAVKAADDLADAVADAVKEASDELVQETLTQHRAQQESLDRFRGALRMLPALLKPPKNGESQRPLVFIIDELDRCRPVFALQTLERIKHFFAVENVHFVLGVNLGQLKTSVAAAYGADVDAGTYLQKFIHLTFQLTTGEGATGERNYGRFVDHLLDRLQFPSALREGAGKAADVIKRVAHKNDLNLRATERIMMTLALAFAFLGRDEGVPPAILGGLCVLKVQQPELFALAKRGALKYSDISNFFGFPTDGIWSEHYTSWDEVGWWWAICSGGGHDNQVRNFVETRLATTELQASTLVAWVANEVVDRLKPL